MTLFSTSSISYLLKLKHGSSSAIFDMATTKENKQSSASSLVLNSVTPTSILLE